MANNRKYRDLTGMKFGKWTVIKKGIRIYRRNIYWLCKCDCGTEKEVQASSLMSGTNKQCMVCSKKPKYIGSMYRKYYRLLETRARKNNFEFTVTPEYLGELFEQQKRKCALSGLSLDFHSNPKNYSGTASLDRIDNTRGYIEGNVQWVHRSINFMKGSLFQKDFIALCKKVAYQPKNITEQHELKEFFWMPSWK
jgi:hypothetical protein